MSMMAVPERIAEWLRLQHNSTRTHRQSERYPKGNRLVKHCGTRLLVG
jgi:hypothetical protein